jgi:ATP-binding cassette subfamily C exporter for protease/lipase
LNAVTNNPGGREPPSLLRSTLNRHAVPFRHVAYLSVVLGVLGLAPTLFMLETYDRVLNSRNNLTLAMLLVLVVGVYVVMALLDRLRSAALARIGTSLDESLRERLFDTSFDINLRSGGGVGNTQAFTDLRVVREFIGSPAMTAIFDAPSALIFGVIVFLIHPILGLLACAGALIQVAVTVRTERKTMPALTAANRASIEAQTYSATALRNTQVIEAMGMMPDIRRRWLKSQHTLLKEQAVASDSAGVSSAIGKFVQQTQASLILGVSCLLAVYGLMSADGGVMILASTLGARMLSPLVQLVSQWRSVANARDSYGRLDRLLGPVTEPQEAMKLAPPKGALTVEGVTVVAPRSANPILRGVSLGLPAGNVLVVIGPSAAGKTTLARVLTGVWPAAAGKVRLDGADIFRWDKDELGPHLGYLPQSVELFDGSIAENIARFGRVDEQEVARAATLAGLDPMLAQLPQGIDSPIGEEGAFLSGGQRQRVALARAIYRSPKLIVLDEPNSSLDEAGDRDLINAIRQLKAQGSTIVVISHRTNMLQVADALLLLRDGQAAMYGPRDEVLAALQKAAAQNKPTPVANPAAGAARPVALQPQAGGAA